MVDQVKLEAVKKVLKFVFVLQKAIENSLQDGKFEVSDLIFFKDAMFGAPTVYNLLPQLSGGLKDFSQIEISEIKEFIVKEFDLKNDKLEEIIEHSLEVAFVIFGLVRKIKG